MPKSFEISGGADPYVTAAIMAALQALWEEEAAGAADSANLSPDAWVMAGRAKPTKGSETRTGTRSTLRTGVERDPRNKR